MARPKKYNISKEEVYKLASYGCTNVEIADFYGCDESLIRKSYSENLTKGRANVKIRLRQLQWDSAEAGNVTMQIFLGKNILGQQDKIEQTELDEPLVWSAD
tara:strand:- start:12 stop:317 length:306 start_codon:yes stop_codon:yes gene_type:complete